MDIPVVLRVSSAGCTSAASPPIAQFSNMEIRFSREWRCAGALNEKHFDELKSLMSQGVGKGEKQPPQNYYPGRPLIPRSEKKAAADAQTTTKKPSKPLLQRQKGKRK